MTRRAEDPSATVPLAQQAEAAHPLWRCAKPCVWTTRMLTALVEGVEGGKWFRLFDKVFAERNLLAALQQVAENDGAPGVDYVTVRDFIQRAPESIWELSDQLKADTYRPQANIMDGMSQWTPESGAPQGAVLSPLLSNVYLDPLDHLMAREGLQMVRYADDFVILCRTAEEAQRALMLVEAWVSENGLTLHPTKTRLVDVHRDGFEFLGYRFQKTRNGIRHWARKKSIQKLRETLRAKTRRTSGRSLQFVIADINRVLRGWFAYFQHSRPFVFVDTDRWIRQRLRAILRKRRNRPGVPKGRDFQRWPNAFFVEHGLFSLAAAHASACQSSRR